MGHNKKDEVELYEVLFEFQRIGNAIRVSAIDPVSNTEITMVGVPGTSRAELMRLAKRKLAWVIARNRRKQRQQGDWWR